MGPFFKIFVLSHFVEMGFQSLASCHEEVDIAWPSSMSFICSSGSSNWLTGGCRTWGRVFDLGRLMGVWLAQNVAGGGAFAQGWFDVNQAPSGHYLCTLAGRQVGRQAGRWGSR